MSDQNDFVIHCGDALEVLKTMPSESVHCCITSPPYYGLRDYGTEGQIGLDDTPTLYVNRLVSMLREVRRVLRNDGTLWLNIGDSYAANRSYQVSQTKDIGTKRDSDEVNYMPMKVPEGCKPKDLIGIPWMLAFALRADGWYLRSEIIWNKPNPMPESVKDRPTKAHEQIFLLSKSPKYFYDADAIREPLSEATLKRDKTPRGRSQDGGGSTKSLAGYAYTGELGNMQSNPLGKNRRSVWNMATKGFKGAHFAVFPPELPRICLLAGCPKGGTALDPFSGAATTGIVAVDNGRKYIGIEINPEYIELSYRRYEGTRTANLDSVFIEDSTTDVTLDLAVSDVSPVLLEL